MPKSRMTTFHSDPHPVTNNTRWPRVISATFLDMKPPNQKTATIGDMLTWAAQSNGKVKRGHKFHLINWCLMNIEVLNALKNVRWSSREWAMLAWQEINRIGISESLELLAPPRPAPLNGPVVPTSRVRQLCGILGLGFNKVNGRIVITRKPLAKISDATDYVDMTFAERGESSPLLPL